MRQVPGFGRQYDLHGRGDDCAYTNDEGGELWMYRRGRKIRFFDGAANQVGPEHDNIVPAIVWAFSNGWKANDAPWRNA